MHVVVVYKLFDDIVVSLDAESDARGCPAPVAGCAFPCRVLAADWVLPPLVVVPTLHAADTCPAAVRLAQKARASEHASERAKTSVVDPLRVSNNARNEENEKNEKREQERGLNRTRTKEDTTYRFQGRRPRQQGTRALISAPHSHTHSSPQTTAGNVHRCPTPNSPWP